MIFEIVKDTKLFIFIFDDFNPSKLRNELKNKYISELKYLCFMSINFNYVLYCTHGFICDPYINFGLKF